jgi:hypothetical protein
LERLGAGRKRRKRLVFDFEWRHRGSCCDEQAFQAARS